MVLHENAIFSGLRPEPNKSVKIWARDVGWRELRTQDWGYQYLKLQDAQKNPMSSYKRSVENGKNTFTTLLVDEGSRTREHIQ